MSRYEQQKRLRLSIERALGLKAIDAGEAMTLNHHYAMGRRAASRYTSNEARVLIADIARRVRTA